MALENKLGISDPVELAHREERLSKAAALTLYRDGMLDARVVNAVTHRNYAFSGDHIRVMMYDDRMEILSPGRLPSIVTLENSATSRVMRQFDTLEASVGQDVMEGLNGYEIAAVQLAMGKGRVTTKDLGERIEKGSSLCARTLKGLAAMGILEWHGSSTHDPSQYYTLAR